MALLHKTQKQLLPSILFFSTLNATLAKKGQSSKAGILSTRQNIFSSPIQSFKQSQRGKKKKFLCVTKNIAFNQTTFVWREDFAFNQIIFFSEFGGVLLWFLLLHQNNCFETKGFLSPICNQQMTNFGKGKTIWGRKKIDTFRSPTRELVLDACYFVDKTRKAAGQWNNRTFSFSSRLHSILSSFHFFLSR